MKPKKNIEKMKMTEEKYRKLVQNAVSNKKTNAGIMCKLAFVPNSSNIQKNTKQIFVLPSC